MSIEFYLILNAEVCLLWQVRIQSEQPGESHSTTACSEPYATQLCRPGSPPPCYVNASSRSWSTAWASTPVLRDSTPSTSSASPQAQVCSPPMRRFWKTPARDAACSQMCCRSCSAGISPMLWLPRIRSTCSRVAEVRFVDKCTR